MSMLGIYEDKGGKALNVRKAPAGEVVGTIAPGTEFEVTAIDRGWCRVEVPTVERGWSEIDAHGWVKAEFVKAEPRKTQDYSQPDYENMTVPELKKLAEERGLEVKAKATKADLVAALEGDE